MGTFYRLAACTPRANAQLVAAAARTDCGNESGNEGHDGCDNRDDNQ
jgi:hypothetical protein